MVGDVVSVELLGQVHHLGEDYGVEEAGKEEDLRGLEVGEVVDQALGCRCVGEGQERRKQREVGVHCAACLYTNVGRLGTVVGTSAY